MHRVPLRWLALGITALLAGGCELEARSTGVDGAFERTLSVAGPIDLDVYSRSGRIQVQVGNANVVHISARIRAYGSMTWAVAYTAAEQVRALEASPPVEQRGNAISIGDIKDEALASGVTIHYDITVPAETRLRTTSRSGDQNIQSIRGPVTASTRSGRIEIQHVLGELDIQSRSGDVDLLDQASAVKVTSRSGNVRLEGQPSRSWVVDTRSGDVDVRLPPDSGVELDVQTRSGAVNTDRPIQMHDVHSRHRLQGTLGTGGARLEVSTRSGAVRIH